MDNLQPVACPYCGHEMRLYQGVMMDGYCYTRYICLDCGAMAPMVRESSVEAAMKKAYEVSKGRAKEHPEPLYPTWYEYQQQTFPEHTRWICPMMFGTFCPCGSITSIKGCTDCRNNPIPADIAEKLGIKPIDKQGGCVK